MARVGLVGQDVTLQVRFYRNGALINPFSISAVKVYDSSTGGTLMSTLSTPTNVSTGVYKVTWSIPTSQSIGTYYDEWTWQAEAGAATKTQRYAFTVRTNTLERAPAKRAAGPLFVGARELSFFHGINKELLQKIICQKVIYYSVSAEHTNVHRLYDEAVRKTVFTPVEINALVLYQEPEQTVDQFSIDTVFRMEVYFYQEELRERTIIPREGDFLKFGNKVYEIEKLNRPQIVYGQIGNEVMVKTICRIARESQFKVFDDIQSFP